MSKSLIKQKVGINLVEGPLFKTLLVFAIPIVLTNLVQQLYTLVDLIIIGQFVGSTGTVGVSTGGELTDLMTPIANAFSAAGQIYIAQLVGAKNSEKLRDTMGTLIGFMMLVSIIVAIGAVVFNKQMLNLLNCPEEAFSQASSYMVITALGMPFIFGYNCIIGILRGMGESKKPLLFVVVAATVNIAFDVVLVAVFHLGAAGTAVATIVSQLGAFIAAFIYMYKRRDHFGFELKWSVFKIKKEPLLIILKLGIPMLIKTILVHFGMIWMRAGVNSYGLVASATNSIGNKISKFLNVFTSGIQAAASAMVAQNLGARKPERAKKVVLYTWACALGVATFASLVSIFAPRFVFGIFTPDPDVIEFGVTYLRIMILSFYLSSTVGPLQSMVTGSGFAMLALVIGILDGLVCRVGFTLIFVNCLDLQAVGYFWGNAFARSLPAIICFIYFFGGKWRTRKLLYE